MLNRRQILSGLVVGCAASFLPKPSFALNGNQQRIYDELLKPLQRYRYTRDREKMLNITTDILKRLVKMNMFKLENVMRAPLRKYDDFCVVSISGTYKTRLPFDTIDSANLDRVAYDLAQEIKTTSYLYVRGELYPYVPVSDVIGCSDTFEPILCFKHRYGRNYG